MSPPDPEPKLKPRPALTGPRCPNCGRHTCTCQPDPESTLAECETCGKRLPGPDVYCNRCADLSAAAYDHAVHNELEDLRAERDELLAERAELWRDRIHMSEQIDQLRSDLAWACDDDE